MKKINSIHYGGKVIGIGCIFSFLVPCLFCMINKFYNSLTLKLLSEISFAIGILILLFFFFYLGVELHQDKKISRYYMLHRKVKIPIGNGLYECLNCGNRKVKDSDTYCSLCGIQFELINDKTPQQILNTKEKK